MAALGCSLGCATTATESQLRKRAAFDFECQEEALDVVELDERTRGVAGCGKRATYVEMCETHNGRNGSYRDNCTWALNADGRPDASAPTTVGDRKSHDGDGGSAESSPMLRGGHDVEAPEKSAATAKPGADAAPDGR